MAIEKDILLEQITVGKYLRVNKKLISILGIQEAVLISDMIDKRGFLRQEGKLWDEEWFFYRGEDIEKNLGLSDFIQRSLFKSLLSKGLVEKRHKPKTTSRLYYYKINSEEILKLLSNE